MKKFVPRTSFFHKEKYMQKENNFLLHNPRIGTYFTALSGRTGTTATVRFGANSYNTEEKEEISS